MYIYLVKLTSLGLLLMRPFSALSISNSTVTASTCETMSSSTIFLLPSTFWMTSPFPMTAPSLASSLEISRKQESDCRDFCFCLFSWNLAKKKVRQIIILRLIRLQWTGLWFSLLTIPGLLSPPAVRGSRNDEEDGVVLQ